MHLFNKTGRRWLAGLELPANERLTPEGACARSNFLEDEIGALEAVLARHALESAQIRRLMTIPGVNVNTVAAFMASWVTSALLLAAQPGQAIAGSTQASGNEAARNGHISKAVELADLVRSIDGPLEGSSC